MFMVSRFKIICSILSINDYVDGFVVDGVSYIRSDYPQYINNDIAQQFCAFVYPNGHFDECIIMQTDAGYDVLSGACIFLLGGWNEYIKTFGV